MSAPKDTTDSSSAALRDHLCSPFLSELMQITKESRRLMMGVYLVEKGYFLHCNRPLKCFLGTYLNDFRSKGWDFWLSKVHASDTTYLRSKIRSFFNPPFLDEFTNLKYRISDSLGNHLAIKHEIFLHRIGRHFVATNYFFDVTEKEKIEKYLMINATSDHSRYPVKHPMSISPREKQVLRLIAEGYSSKEIADKLFISNHTAISHRKNLIEKFQVKNTAHLVNRASKVVLL